MSQQINLFNPVFLQQKKYLSAVTMAQALGLLLVGALLLSGYVTYRASKLAADAVVARNQLKEAQGQMAMVNVAFPLPQKNKTLQEQIRKVEAEMASLQKVTGILQEGHLGNATGHAEYLRAFARQIVDGVWLTGFSIQEDGAEINMQGRALRPELVPAYINRLKQEPVLQGKSFAALQMQVPQLSPAPGPGKQDAGAHTSGAAPYVEFRLESTAQAVPTARPVAVGLP